MGLWASRSDVEYLVSNVLLKDTTIKLMDARSYVSSIFCFFSRWCAWFWLTVSVPRKNHAKDCSKIQVLEQRVETLERELDAAISAAARARTEKRQAEAAQKAAELRAQEVTRELENTTSNFFSPLFGNSYAFIRINFCMLNL